MRSGILAALAALAAAASPVRAAAFDEAGWALPAAAAPTRPPAALAAPHPNAAPAPEETLRAALKARLPLDPVAAEFLPPVLDGSSAVAVALDREADDKALRGAWASYRRDRRALVVNLDAVEEDARGRGAAPPNAQTLADRYLPVFVHELAGHARHYAELAKILGAPAPNVRETEICALWLEAMSVAAERRLRPDYLRDGSAYAADESRLVDKYWEAKRRGNFEVFRAYASTFPAYAKIASAYDGASASSPVAAYFRAEENRIREADRRLIGDARPGEETTPERRTFDDARALRR